MKKQNQVFFIITIFFILTMLMTSISYADQMKDPITDPNSYRPAAPAPDSDIKLITEKGGIILKTTTTIGIVVAVLTLIILGIKYMMGSIEEKAEYKKTMLPYIIGVIMLTSISGILMLLSALASNLNKIT